MVPLIKSDIHKSDIHNPNRNLRHKYLRRKAEQRFSLLSLRGLPLSFACCSSASRCLSSAMAKALVVLLALALVAVVSVVAQQERDPNLRLIKLSEEDSGAWMTQAQIDSLAQRRIGFMDVTVRAIRQRRPRYPPAWLTVPY